VREKDHDLSPRKRDRYVIAGVECCSGALMLAVKAEVILWQNRNP
jgi:hypothetical protein